MLELTVRLVVSLAFVVGLLLLVVRLGGRRFQTASDAPVRVVARQALTRGSAVALVEVGGRLLVIGTTDQQVSMLTELEPDALTAPAPVEPVSFSAHVDAAVRELHVVAEPAVEAAPVVRPRGGGAHVAPRRTAPALPGALAGSVLSAGTWKQAVSAARGRR